MNWSVKRYVEELRERGIRCTGRQEMIEEEICELFPPGEAQLVHRPCVVVDSEGIILLWYLPRLLSLKRGVSFHEKLSTLSLMIT